MQDSWSVLDHKIKYKKAIPIQLKRRINTLAALFELADREFREIREATAAEIKREETEIEDADAGDVLETVGPYRPGEQRREVRSTKLNAFNFQKIAMHFFPGYEFEAHKVDGFVQELVSTAPAMTRASFNTYMNRNVGTVKRYQTYFESTDPSNRMNPFTVIRHCLYLGDKAIFNGLLTAVAKANFEAWLANGMPSPARAVTAAKDSE